MARPKASRDDRARAAHAAASALPNLIALAMQAERGNPMAAALAWARVDNAAGTVHRQARILAGKPRGG